ncbi:MAG: T9SS type A sorting domain-containing protein [Bacteroidetes bacterium]|nr:T9SS type A sorting domain-containing protein [Bacteroidota bacterium]
MRKKLLVALAAIASVAFSQVPTAGLIGRWEFSGNANDASGSGNHGTVSGATLITDRCGNLNSAYNFNGTSDYIEMLFPGPLGSSARSVSFWARSTNTTLSPQAVFDYGFSNAMGGEFEVIYNYNCNGVGIDVSNEALIRSNSCLMNNDWHHIVVVLDPTVGTQIGQLLIYVDGVLQTTISCFVTGTTANFNTMATWPITIGSGANPPSSRYFQGDLDDYYLYNRALTAAEVLQLFNMCPAPILGNINPCIGTGETYTATPVIGATAYNWILPGGWSGTSATNTINTTVGTAGVITVNITNGCGAIVTQTLAVGSNTCACPQATSGIQVLPTTTTGIISGGSYIINQNTTLTGGTTFMNAEFLIAPNVQLIVPPGGQFVLKNAHLYGCLNGMWQGIDVQDGGSIVSVPVPHSSLIEDAIIAVNVNNITAAHWTPPIEITGVIFNKNHTAINIRNSTPSVNNLPVLIKECVFTSRAMPFTSVTWPSSDVTATGLRYAAPSATTGLTAPYNLLGYALTNTKPPYSTQPGETGILINNIGNVPGGATSTGVDIGVFYAGNDTQFNLFDGIGYGMDVMDASLTTMNNVFQNMLYFSTSSGMIGGTGIRGRMSAGSLMNARLSTSPIGAGTQNTSYGCRFWECYMGIQTDNVYEIDAQYGICRSTQTFANGGAWGPGNTGYFFRSNRFKYTVNFSEFNNINYALYMQNNPGNYDMGSGVINGIYAGNIEVKQNYFGAEVSSSTPIGTEYLADAIHLTGPNSAAWQIAGSGSIISNKINRAYRGVSVFEMNNYRVSVNGNLISLVDDNMLTAQQYGIEGVQKQGGLFVMSNTLSATGTSNPFIRLVYCKTDNAPTVTCNKLSASYNAFVFEGPNPGTIWNGNTMQNHARGLHLLSNGSIGPQGGPGAPSGNQWLGAWGGPNFQTFTTASNAALSAQLFVSAGAITNPIFHGNAGGAPYNPGLITVTPGIYSCKNLNLPAPPTNRLFATSTSNEENDNAIELQQMDVELFPNPSTGQVMINATETDGSLRIRIMDINGKVVFTQNAQSENIRLDVSSLKEAVYFVEINSNTKTAYKKLIISK